MSNRDGVLAALVVAALLSGAGFWLLRTPAAEAAGSFAGRGAVSEPVVVADGPTSRIVPLPYVDPGADDESERAASSPFSSVPTKEQPVLVRWSDGSAYVRASLNVEVETFPPNVQTEYFYEYSRTDGEGRASLRLPTSGTGKLRIEARGALPYTTPTFDFATPPETFDVPLGAVVLGQARFKDGRPATGLILAMQTEAGVGVQATVGADGGFRFRGLLPGTAEFSLRGRIAAGMRIAEVSDGVRQDDFSFTGRTPSTPELVLSRLPHATGRALREDGSTITGETVTICRLVDDKRVPLGQGPTLADGGFAVPLQTPPAETAPPYRLEAVLQLEREGTYVSAAEIQTFGDDVAFAPILVPKPRLVRLLVLGPADAPVRNATIEFEPEARELRLDFATVLFGSAKRVTGRDGRTTFEGRGRMKLTVRKTGFDPLKASLDVAATAPDEAVVLRLLPGPVFIAAIDGKPEDSAGLKVRVTGKSALTAGEESVLNAEVADGAATFNGLISGVEFSVVMLDAANIPTSPVTVPALLPGETRRLLLPRPQPSCVLAVQVVAADGKPAAGRRILVRSAEASASVGADPADDSEDWSEYAGGQTIVTTDAEGRAEVVGWRCPKVTVQAALLDIEHRLQTDGAEQDAAELVVNLSPPRTEAKLVLQRRRVLTVVVKDPQGRHAEFERPRFWRDGTTRLAVSERHDRNNVEDARHYFLPPVPVRVVVRVAGRDVEAVAGAEAVRLEIPAEGLGWVRTKTEKRAGPASIRKSKFVVLTPVEGGEPLMLGMKSSFGAIGGGADISRMDDPVWAGRYRRTVVGAGDAMASTMRNSRLGAAPVVVAAPQADPSSVDVVVEPGRVLVLDLDGP